MAVALDGVPSQQEVGGGGQGGGHTDTVPVNGAHVIYGQVNLNKSINQSINYLIVFEQSIKCMILFDTK